MLARLIRFLVCLPILVILIGFILLNRGDMDLVISPFHDLITLPIMSVGVVFFGIGFLAGLILLWLDYGEVRKTSRDLKKQVKTLEKQLAASREAHPQEDKP